MSLDQTPHQTVTRFGCVGFSMYACGFFGPQMRQFCLFTYPPRSKWALSVKMIFFAKIDIFCKAIADPFVQTYTQSYSFGRSIKLIICQIRHELSVIMLEISTKSFWVRRLFNVCVRVFCDNFACLHTWQDRNELHLKKWFFFLSKSASSVSRSQAHFPALFKHISQPNYLSNQT